eukprot:CAMPEP_0178397576 /NCGR_PEP_ID=MMETSP0689_2-20121128/14320_1 /TAXON_ID=160604 /ORGANISM="Amphidinium massartii, Strain CS-259" /LENGTH=372 /DNA_ID=CAMNT_0020018295 /DNA_START=51 /DNA_END=1169 /DNA_ORIENTATION=-
MMATSGSLRVTSSSRFEPMRVPSKSPTTQSGGVALPKVTSGMMAKTTSLRPDALGKTNSLMKSVSGGNLQAPEGLARIMSSKHPDRDLRSIGQTYEQVVKTFRKYDVDRDNKLSHQELHKLMMHLNPHSWTDKKTKVLMKAIDSNCNGAIDMTEFLDYIFPKVGVEQYSSIRNATGGFQGLSEYEMVMEQFRGHDANGNGTMDKDEFSRLMMTLRPGGWSQRDTERVFAAVDKDRSGEVDCSELVAYLFKIPSDQQKAARAKHRGSGSSGALLNIEIVSGDSHITVAKQLERGWVRRFGNELDIRVVVRPDTKGILSVSARNGAVVFWDRATMAPYRDDPFATPQDMHNWFDDMTRFHIPNLIQATIDSTRD